MPLSGRLLAKNFKSTAYAEVPLDGTHLVAVRGIITKRYSTQKRQREDLVGAALLRSIRTNRSSLMLPMPIS